MEKYTLYNSSNDTIIAKDRPWPNKTPGTPPADLPSDVHLLLQVVGDSPDYDEATQKLGGYGEPVIDLQNYTATKTQTVVEMTEEEISDYQRQKDRDAIAEAWHSTPDYIHANYTHLYEVANSWLDKGEDNLALTVVQDAEPLQSIKDDATKLATFNAVKAQMIASIEAL